MFCPTPPRTQATLSCLLIALPFLAACAPVVYSLPKAQRADAESTYRTPAFTVRPPAGRWRFVSLAEQPPQDRWSLRSLDIPGRQQDEPDTSKAELGVVFCQVARFGVQTDNEPPSPLGPCVSIAAYRLSIEERTQLRGDLNLLAQKIALAFTTDTGGMLICSPWSVFHPTRWVTWHGHLDTVHVGEAKFLEFRRLASDGTAPEDCIRRDRAAILFYITPEWLYRFYLPDSKLDRGSQEWHVLESFQPAEGRHDRN